MKIDTGRIVEATESEMHEIHAAEAFENWNRRMLMEGSDKNENT